MPRARCWASTRCMWRARGVFAAFIAASDAERALQIMGVTPLGAGSAVIGQVAENSAPLVTLKSAIGASRILDMPSGEAVAPDLLKS